jgi:Immunity protein 27
MIKLKKSETMLCGSWEFRNSRMEADDVCRRIDKLIAECLIEIAVDESGWNKLFLDPVDKRYWELSFPNSEMPSGGPPCLKSVTLTDAKSKYKF